MKEHDIRRLFPNASPSLLAANAEVSDAKPECNKASALERAVPGEKQGIRRVRIRITGYRVRPLDPDNFAGSVKDLLDGLRHAALIPGDEPWRIRLETEQEKVSSYKEERTVITLTP